MPHVRGPTYIKCKLMIGKSKSFLRCKFLATIWYDRFKWLGVKWVLHHDLRESFVNHNCPWLGKGSTKAWRVVWTIRNLRNKVIFTDGVVGFPEAVEIIRFRAWSWISSKWENADRNFSETIEKVKPILDVEEKEARCDEEGAQFCFGYCMERVNKRDKKEQIIDARLYLTLEVSKIVNPKSKSKSKRAPRVAPFLRICI
ncbi:hypothetical protein HKD37_07G020427 [Glycine soja]